MVAETLGYVLVGPLGAEGGGLCSSEDADADGVEGGHATFTPAQVRRGPGRPPELVGPALDWYGVTEAGNWEGTTVLPRPLGAPLARPPEVEEARRLLLEARRRRPRPARDDKVVCEWNAMAAAVLAEAAGAMEVAGWAGRAEEVGDLLFTAGRLADGRWVRTVGGRQPAFAADYAWLLECCTRLAELHRPGPVDRPGAPRWQTPCSTCSSTRPTGGSSPPGATPSGWWCGPRSCSTGPPRRPTRWPPRRWPASARSTGDDRYRHAAERIVALAGPLLADHPTAVADLVAAASMLDAPIEVVVAGDRPDLLSEVRRRWLPDAVVAWGEPTASPLWEGRAPGERLRLPPVRMPGAGRRPRYPGRPARRRSSSGGTATGG